MVATKIPGGVDLTDVLKDFLGDEPVGTDTDTRAARRDARRDAARVVPEGQQLR